MGCYHPLLAWYAKERGESGKRAITFRAADGFKDRPVSVPCGTCLGCRLERAREWAVRCMHEASLHEKNCFLTLTYDDEHLPEGRSLRPKDVVDFLKRLRFRYGKGIRFFQCGEYGEREGRPHHHMVLFGHDFGDRELFRERNGVRLDTSVELGELWPFGFSTVGGVTMDSAGYVARYTLKKVGRPGRSVDGRVAEYLTMSRRPGIGRAWIDRYLSDVYPSDELVVNGVVTRPPRYYDDQLARQRPEVFKALKEVRRGEGQFADPSSDRKGARLTDCEEVKVAAVRPLSRELEA